VPWGPTTSIRRTPVVFHTTEDIFDTPEDLGTTAYVPGKVG